MALVTLDIFTGAYPLIASNSLKYVVYKSDDYPTEFDSQTFAAPHPDRTVSFPGLDRVNYIWKVLEMNGVTVVRERGSFNVVPNDENAVDYKAPIMIQVDTTVGLVNTTTSFVFDGTGGTFDWRGYEIYTERVGQGTMKKGGQYTWDSTTGTFTLLEAGDQFQPEELFNIEFGLIVTATSGGVATTNLFSGTMVITGATTLLAADAGKNIIINGAAPYFQIDLPDINTVPSSKPFYFEGGIGSHINVRIATVMSQEIDWLKGARLNMKIGVCESFEIYRQEGTTTWRVRKPEGNFKTVGRIIHTDADITDEFNCVEMDGASLSVDSYCRLYEDHVLRLDPSKVCAFADWATGDNKYKYSYSSGGVFHVPDRRGMYLRNSDGSIVAGTYQADTVGPILTGATITITKGYSYTNSPNNDIFGNGANNPQSKTIPLTINTGNTETRPKTVVIKNYILI